MFSATKFVVAGAIVALFGGLLLVAQPRERVAVTVPGAEMRGLPPVTGPAGNGLIAFERDGDIYIGDPVTGSSEVIAQGEGSRGMVDGAYWRPLFSPDGSRIAFMRVIDFVEVGCEVIVIRADGSEPRDITPEGFRPICIQSFSWTPDGRGIVVPSFPTPLLDHDAEVLLLDASGAADPVPLLVDSSFGAADPEFLRTPFRPPTGDHLLIVDGEPALGMMDLDGGDVVDLGELSGLVDLGYATFADPGWSPDGTRIAVLAWAGHERHLYVMEADGSDLRRLTAIPWHERWQGPRWSWSPDGSTIAAQYSDIVEYSPESCPGETDGDPCADADWITLIDVESGEERVLDSTRSPTGGEGSIWNWSWSPDGTAILLTRRPAYSRTVAQEVVDIETDTATVLPWEVGQGFLSWQRVAAD